MHGLSMAPWFHSVDVGSNAPLKGKRGLAKLCSHAASATQAEQARFNGQPTQGVYLWLLPACAICLGGAVSTLSSHTFSVSDPGSTLGPSVSMSLSLLCHMTLARRQCLIQVPAEQQLPVHGSFIVLLELVAFAFAAGCHLAVGEAWLLRCFILLQRGRLLAKNHLAGLVFKVGVHCEGHAQLLSEEMLYRDLAQVLTHAYAVALSKIPAQSHCLQLAKPAGMKYTYVSEKYGQTGTSPQNRPTQGHTCTSLCAQRCAWCPGLLSPHPPSALGPPTM